MTRFVAIGWAALGAVVASVVLIGFVLPRTELKSASPDAPADAERAVDGTVHLEPDRQGRAGVTIALPRSGTAPVLEPAYARALDVAPLAAIDSEIAAASAAAGASRAEAVRLAGLAAEDQSASVRSVEAARAQAMADQARVDLASRRIGLEFGPGLARLGVGQRRALVADIAAGRASLVRIDRPGGAVAGRVRVIDGDVSTLVAVLGPAALSDARLQSAGVLAIVRGPLAASATAGRVLTASVETNAAEAGAILTRDSLIRWRGGLWAYVQSAPDTFVRRELVDARPVQDGWFVQNGFGPQDRIVVGGAGVLLAIERGGDAPAEED